LELSEIDLVLLCSYRHVLDIVAIINPHVLKCFLGRWSNIKISGQKLTYEVFCFFGNEAPDWVIEGELGGLDILDDLLIGVSSEWGSARQSHVKYNS
jgi:hypothetical protein